MTDHNEKLIAEARETLKRPDGANLVYAEELLMRDLADALEAAEKAPAPTDDEREAQIKCLEDEVEYRVRTAVALSKGGHDHNEQVRQGRASIRFLAAGFRRSEVPEPSAEQRGTPRPHKDGEAWCTSKSPLYPGSHGYDRCWGAQGHPEPLHVSASRRWSDPEGEPSDAQVAEIEQRVYDQHRGQIAGMAKALVRAGWDAAVEGQR